VTTPSEPLPGILCSNENKERVVFWLPRGCILIDGLETSSSDAWSVRLTFCDEAGNHIQSTHFHDSYENEWRKSPETQLGKLGVPLGDWDYARLALDAAIALRLRASLERTEAVVLPDDKHISVFAPSMPIYLRKVDPIEQKKGRCRDSAAALEGLVSSGLKPSLLESALQAALVAVSDLHGEQHLLVRRLEKLADFDAADMSAAATRAEQAAAVVRTAERTTPSKGTGSQTASGNTYITNVRESNLGALSAGPTATAIGAVAPQLGNEPSSKAGFINSALTPTKRSTAAAGMANRKYAVLVFVVLGGVAALSTFAGLLGDGKRGCNSSSCDKTIVASVSYDLPSTISATRLCLDGAEIKLAPDADLKIVADTLEVLKPSRIIAVPLTDRYDSTKDGSGGDPGRVSSLVQ
jgi:hypothetical protein